MYTHEWVQVSSVMAVDRWERKKNPLKQIAVSEQKWAIWLPLSKLLFSMNIIGFILKNIILKKICWYLNQNSRYGPITKWFNWLTKGFQQQNRLSGILHNSFNNAYKNKQLYITRQHQYKAESYQFYCSYMHTMDIYYTG